MSGSGAGIVWLGHTRHPEVTPDTFCHNWLLVIAKKAVRAPSMLIGWQINIHVWVNEASASEHAIGNE